MRHHYFVVLVALLIAPGCASQSAERIGRSFGADGIAKVVVRAAEAQSATVTTSAPRSTIQVSGLPTGGAPGYHPPDPSWRETSAQRWGFDFVAERHGDVLII